MSAEAPLACTLTTPDRRARLDSARELGKRALVELHVRDGRALLRFHGERERVEALVAAESECCAFFEFALTGEGEDTELEIETPAGGEPLLRALVAGIVVGWDGGVA